VLVQFANFQNFIYIIIYNVCIKCAKIQFFQSLSTYIIVTLQKRVRQKNFLENRNILKNCTQKKIKIGSVLSTVVVEENPKKKINLNQDCSYYFLKACPKRARAFTGWR
jgi:hypothetical protein